MGGTSREYLTGRLRKEGHFALLAAVERGDISAYAAAEEAGFVTRRGDFGDGVRERGETTAVRHPCGAPRRGRSATG